MSFKLGAKLIFGAAAILGMAMSGAAYAQTVQASQATPADSDRPSQEGRTPLPLGSAYRLQPGDAVTVNFRFTPEFNEDVVIGPDGHVMLKSTGDLRLVGLSLLEAQREIIRESSSKLVNPEVAVSLKDFDRPHVVVGGDVQTPGRFDLRKPTTALQAILMAGGPKEDSAMGRVLLFRRLNSETAEVHVLQLGNFRGKEKPKGDMMLQPDDMILVSHDKLSKIERFVKIANIGVYFDPLSRVNF